MPLDHSDTFSLKKKRDTAAWQRLRGTVAILVEWRLLHGDRLDSRQWACWHLPGRAVSSKWGQGDAHAPPTHAMQCNCMLPQCGDCDKVRRFFQIPGDCGGQITFGIVSLAFASAESRPLCSANRETAKAQIQMQDSVLLRRLFGVSLTFQNTARLVWHCKGQNHLSLEVMTCRRHHPRRLHLLQG